MAWMLSWWMMTNLNHLIPRMTSPITLPSVVFKQCGDVTTSVMADDGLARNQIRPLDHYLDGDKFTFFSSRSLGCS